jgi:hypothetical protein
VKRRIKSERTKSLTQFNGLKEEGEEEGDDSGEEEEEIVVVVVEVL